MGWKEEFNAALSETQGNNKATTSQSSGSSNSFLNDFYANVKTSRKKKNKWEEVANFHDTIAPLYSARAAMKEIEAPVKNEQTPAKDDRKWFQKVTAFDDGYDFGDITRTILGSGADLLEHASAGIMGMGETALDAFMYLAPAMNAAMQSQNSLTYNFDIQEYRKQQEDAKEFIAKDLYNEEEIAKAIISDPLKRLNGIDTATDSVFGEKSDALIQSGGQLVGQAALQAVGVPWFVTSGLTSFGAEAENAFNQGAAYDEAGGSALVAAGAEILTEKISGGISFGGKTLDDALTQQIALGISNKTLRTLAKLGMDMSGEGAEEVLSGIMGAIGQKLTYADNQELSELFSAEDAWESFVGGAVLGGGSSVISNIRANENGVDAVTGLNENEQKVVDAVYNARVEEAEKDGKISQKEKGKIYDSVLNDMDKGRISIETIEEALGGDAYTAYNDLVKEAEEYKTLYETKSGDLSKKDQDRLDELIKKNEANPYETALQTAKDSLSESVFGISKDSRLAESYNERARRGQAFEADLTQYDTKQQAVIQKAIDSGILNNTNRTHEFVDLIAKISADKGVSFNFANNEKLKESGFALDGVQVNGFVTKDGITLNIDAAKALNSTVGHEITHVLEGTELYTELQGVLFEYAKNNKTYWDKRHQLEKLYSNVADANIDAELTADLVGDLLFTDTDFIKRLSVEHRNVFQKIYDEIKYLCKVVTAGSKEARQLERVKRAFEEAYRADSKGLSDTKYSLSSIASTFFGNENMTSIAFEEADYRQTEGYKRYVDQCVNNIRQTRADFDETVARQEIEASIDGIVRVALAAKKAGYDIYDDQTRRSKRDSKNRLLFSSLEPNSDYFTSSDISTICDKRKNFAGIYDEIVREEESRGVPESKRFFANVDNYFYLHKLMAEKGLTQPCRQCYVESMRKNLAPMANAFLRLVGETNPNNTANDQLYQQKGRNKGQPKTNNAKIRENVLELLSEYGMTVGDLNVETLTTADGLAALKIQAPMVYEAFNSFYGQSKPKMPKAATPFRFGELTALLTDEHGRIKQSLVDKINSTGGFRLQSYSDFQIQNYTDVLQVIFEAGTLGLNGHAYTKVPAFLEATEGTNLKRNISIFMYKDGDEWKLDRNDSFPYTLEEIYEIVQADKTGNTGIIAVSQNAEMSAWIMANDNIGYGIPFHKSGLKMNTVRDTVVKEDGREIKGYTGTKDHTKQQTEVWAKASDDHKALTKVKNGINIYSEEVGWDFENKSGLPKNKLIEKNVKAYIDACNRAGYLPKFREYVMNNDKVLNDVLKYSKKLGFVSENATIDDISFEYEGYRIPYGYYKFLGDFGMFTPDGKAAPQESLSLKNYDFEKAVEFFADSETLRRNEILQQFANGEERQRYKDSNLTAEELQEIVQQRRSEVADGVVSRYDAPVQHSLSEQGETPKANGNNVYGKDIALAPVKAEVTTDKAKVTTDKAEVTTDNVAEEDVAPVVEESPVTEDVAPVAEEATKAEPAVQQAANENTANKPIQTVKERLAAKLENAQTELANNQKLREDSLKAFDEEIAKLQEEYDGKKNKNTIAANNILRRIERLKRIKRNVDADYAKRISDAEKRVAKTSEEIRTGESASEQGAMRKELHKSLVDRIKTSFAEHGFDFDAVLRKAKNLSTFATVDNTPQRVMEKSLGYEEGQILADMTVNKVAQNESAGIKWLNSYTNRKNGILAQISKQYNIKPGSKESAAAQMYAEGFYVDENNDIVAYGDVELAKDFPDPKVQANIKGLASDQRIRQIYDETLAMINESRTRNAYPEIQKLDNYFLHFRAMDDTFSRLGLPFNPNDIRAKDLPTDLNGVTADLKPGQPYFSSALHRTGKRTSFDLLGGLERYLTSAKNQIYHIDDIQTLRALRNYIADTYGQAHGLEGLDALSEEEAEERVKQVYGSHLSTFAKFLNEEANVIAGKTALIDRGIEGIIGRRGITFLNTVRKQTGSNMVGYNISSSLTNFLPVAQTLAKANKADFVKAFAQTVSSKVSSVFGKTDDFVENNPTLIRRNGADRFASTLWQKLSDPGYILMGAVDNISTELIVRTKYNEYIRKGMDSEQAVIEADKWTSRLMGDRSLGQQPQIFNSKMLGLVTQFQIEVRNQLDSQFYDTIQEAKMSNKDIQNGLERNAKTAAKVASTFVQLAVVQHLFGKAFESIAGYNPAFDIIEVLIKTFGFDDEEESEDTALDNIEQGFFELLEDLPYTSVLTDGGRIPISSALPIQQFIRGEDKYGNEKSRLETLGEIAPYYLMPSGYGQLKKTIQGLNMFDEDLPIAGSYTDSGNLRFPVEDTLGNRIQAGIFGQWASENARKYFNEEHRTLNPEQTAIFAELDIPIEEYWDYQNERNAFYDFKDEVDAAADADNATDEDIVRAKYLSAISSDIYKLYEEQKQLASGNSYNKQKRIRDIQNQMAELLADGETGIDDVYVDGYYAEVGDRRFDFNPEENEWYEIKPYKSDGTDNYFYQKEQEVTKGLGISYSEYWNNREEYDYAYDNPGKYAVAQAVGGYDSYMAHYEYLEDWKSPNYIGADKDENGKSISGSRKPKVIDYINDLDADYGEKIILFKSQYPADDTYNHEIIDYLNSRDDISYDEMVAILKELGFKVNGNNVTW